MLIAMSFTATAFMFIRIRYGIDLTDEAWIYSSNYIGFNDGMPFGFSILWHNFVTVFNLSVLQIRIFRLIASTALILILSRMLTKFDAKEVLESTRDKNVGYRVRSILKDKKFLRVATFGLLGNLLSYSYLPPFLGYNESVVLFTQVNIIAIVFLVKSPNTSKRIQYIFVALLAFSSVATFISKFSSGIITIILVFIFLFLYLDRMLSWLYLITVHILAGTIFLSTEVFKTYLYQIFLVLTDSVRAEHFGHKSSEIILKSISSLKYFLPLSLLIYLLIVLLTKNIFIKVKFLYSTLVIAIFFILAVVISRLNLDSQVGFPSNYNYLRLFMMLLVGFAFYLLGVALKSSPRNVRPKNSNKYLYLLSFALVFTQPLGSINEPWGILSASSGTILILITSLVNEPTMNKRKIPDLFPLASTVVAGIVFMTVYSGMLMPYRQTPVFQDKFQISTGPLKGIWTDEKTLKFLQKLDQDTKVIKTLGVTDLIALDTPVIGILEPSLVTQPIWLAQWWGITPDVLVENCLSSMNFDRRFALYLPNGEPKWPQLEDALILCGLERDKAENSQVKLLRPIGGVDDSPKYCAPSLKITRSLLGQGWWPADEGPFWSNNGYINLQLSNISNVKRIVVPFSTLNPEVRVELVGKSSNQKLDTVSNTIIVDASQDPKGSEVWLKVSNGRRPIDIQGGNLDVRELGILVADLRVDC
jgi:hypothetical protein